MKVLKTETKWTGELVAWEDVHYRRARWTRGGRFPREGWGYVYDPENGEWHKHGQFHKWGWHRVTRVHRQPSKNYARAPDGVES